MDDYFKSSSSSSNSHNIGENILEDLLETPLLPISSFENFQVDNSIPQRNNVYMYINSLNMRSARTLTQSIIFTILPDIDIIQSLIRIAFANSIYVSVVFGDGFVSEFDISFPGYQSSLVKFFGYYRILSFSGTCDGHGATSLEDVVHTFNVSAVSDSGEFIGGLVITSMKAASPVTLMASIGITM